MNDIDINNQKLIFEDFFINVEGLLSEDNKFKYAQYYTGEDIALYMANMFKNINKEIIRVLDPGCGIGILTSAF